MVYTFDMNQIIYNSFPRSGNVYAGYVGSHIIWGNHSMVHIPQIFGTKDLDMISIFRKPENAIASLINKRLESNRPVTVDTEFIQGQSKIFCDEYKQYLDGAEMHNKYTYIVNFDNFIKDPVKHFVDISNRFNRTLLKDYEESFRSLTFSGKLWEDKHDGHVPREKDATRLFIEDVVGSMNCISHLNDEYRSFIQQYESYKPLI